MIPSHLMHVTEDVGNLLKMLVFFSQRDKASKLQETFNAYLDKVKAGLRLLLPVIVPAIGEEEEKEQEKKKEAATNKQAQALLQRADWSLSLFQ